jgi:hypothetical protein
MDEVAKTVGTAVLVILALAMVTGIPVFVVRLFVKSRPPQIVGAELPVVHETIDLSKRYDIVYGTGYGATHEKLTGVRILGYLRSDRDQTTGQYMDSRWLVGELPDGRRAYLRPRSVLWLLEAIAA